MEPPGPDSTNDDVLPDGEHGRQPYISRTLARPSIVWALPIFAISSFVSALRTVAALAIYLRLDPDYLHLNPNAVHESIVQTFLDGADVNSASLAHMWFLLSLPASVGWLTHAWWGQRADAWGRTVVLAISAAAATSTGINILLVSYIRPSRFDLWLIPGAILEGLFGGAGMSAALAYLSDCSPAHHRAAVFSISNGLSVVAYSLGARPGPLPTHPAVLLCVSIAWNVIAAGLWAFVVPESLSQDVRAAKRAEPIIHWPSGQRRLLSYLALPLECVRAFVRPLGILRPRLKDEAHPTQGRDWSVFYLAGAAIFVYVGRYAATIFLWLLRLRHFHDRQWFTLQAWISVFCQAAFLLVGVPAISAVYQWRRARSRGAEIVLPGEDDQLLPAVLPEHRDAEEQPVETTHAPASRGDLFTTRTLLLLSTFAFTFALLPAAPPQHIGSIMGISISSAIHLCIKSLAFALVSGDASQAGTFFGAFEVLFEIGVIGLQNLVPRIVSPPSEPYRGFIVVTVVTLSLAYAVTYFVRRK